MWLNDIAVQRPISGNFSSGGMIRPLQGLVLHIQQGTEDGTYSWFNNTQSQVSAHFGNPKVGPLEQFVDTDDVAWAQVSGNRHWISVENEGKSGDSLTNSQIDNVASLLGWLYWNEDVPLRLAETPAGYGLGYHSMGGKAWGGHPDCPGDPIVSQRLLIIERAGFWRPASGGVSA